MSPYQEALYWIEQHHGTGSARSLAQLILSLWNGDAAFSFRDCISNLDDDRTRLALAMVTYFVRHGENAELVEIGHRVCKQYPKLWELGMAGSDAQRELLRKWRDEEQAQYQGNE